MRQQSWGEADWTARDLKPRTALSLGYAMGIASASSTAAGAAWSTANATYTSYEPQPKRAPAWRYVACTILSEALLILLAVEVYYVVAMAHS